MRVRATRGPRQGRVKGSLEALLGPSQGWKQKEKSSRPSVRTGGGSLGL